MVGQLGKPSDHEPSGDFVMTNFARLAALAVAATLVATPAVAAPAAATPKAKATAKIVKPLSLTATRDLDFGTILVGTVAGTETVSISQDGTTRTCGAGGGLTCSGTFASATYNVTGTKQFTVNIAAAASDLTNTTSGNSEKLAFTPNAPATLLLTNSGAPGSNFSVGGSIGITSATVDGLYSGDIEVTVDY